MHALRGNTRVWRIYRAVLALIFALALLHGPSMMATEGTVSPIPVHVGMSNCADHAKSGHSDEAPMSVANCPLGIIAALLPESPQSAAPAPFREFSVRAEPHLVSSSLTALDPPPRA